MPLEIVYDHIYYALATRSNLYHNQSSLRIYGSEHTNAVVSLQDKLQEMNLPSIYAIVFSKCEFWHVKGFWFWNNAQPLMSTNTNSPIFSMKKSVLYKCLRWAI